MESQTRVCLVGAGHIANTHAEVLQHLRGIDLTGMVETNDEVAQQFAQRFGIKQIFASAEAAIAANAFDVAHILTPPDTHADLALSFVEAGTAVFIEKPPAVDFTGLAALENAVQNNPDAIGVNLNALYQPAFRRLMNLLERGRVGPVRSVNVVYSLPLRQLAAGHYTDWMFHDPANMLLEQAIHPLAQIFYLLDDSPEVTARPGRTSEISPGVDFHRQWSFQIFGRRNQRPVAVALHFEVGAEFPVWSMAAVGDDGVISADMVANRCIVDRRGPWLDMISSPVAGLDIGWQVWRQSWRNLARYGASQLNLAARNDPFYLSMRDSIHAFYRDLANGPASPADAALAIRVARACLLLAGDTAPRPAAKPPKKDNPAPQKEYEFAVIGGTGFIGRYIIKALVNEGTPVRVVARRTDNLPALFYDPLVEVVTADIHDWECLSRALAGVRRVINCAHGGTGASADILCKSMANAAAALAQACRSQGVRSVVHLGTVASLYLGNAGQSATGMTPLDPKAQRRSAYSRAKARAEQVLTRFWAEQGLPVCILRPGIVVGAGGEPYHSGVGWFNSTRHCLGWNRGRNPLPFVLADDVAQACILAARDEKSAGKSFNVVGGVNLSARSYIAALARTTGRPLRYHARWPIIIWAQESLKWAIKRIAGRGSAYVSWRDIRSRGMCTPFDTTDIRQALGWTPVDCLEDFLEKALPPYGRDRDAAGT